MKIICIGRNYIDHAKELKNPIPKQPLIFMKPPTALLLHQTPLFYPKFTKELHHEVEIVLKINKAGKYIEEKFAHRYYEEIGIGIDFTARDLQAKLKGKSHPWEIAKAFDGSAPMGKFINISTLKDKKNIEFHLTKNGATIQEGNTKDLIFNFEYLISYVSQYFKLQRGDLIMTGTPAGVGPVKIGDVLEGYIENQHLLHCQIR